MKSRFWLLALMFAAVGFASDDVKIDPKEALADLEQSKTIFAAQLQTARDYCKGYDLEQIDVQVFPYRSHDDSIQILEVIFGEKDVKFGQSSIRVHVQVYFTKPTHFEQTVKGLKNLKFYKLETTVHRIQVGPPQPGGSSSAG